MSFGSAIADGYAELAIRALVFQLVIALVTGAFGMYLLKSPGYNITRERISREEGYKVLLAEIAARDKKIDKLREAIRRLADQDATLSVCDGNVTVTMDATLADAEREAVEQAAGVCELDATDERRLEIAATLRGLLERRE